MADEVAVLREDIQKRYADEANARIEKIRQDYQSEYDAQMEKLRAEGREKSVKFRELFAQKLTNAAFLSMLQARGLL